MRTIAADQRSAFPHRMGVPSWGAVLIALTGTLVGLAIDAASGNRELGAASSPTSPAWPGGDIAKNQRVIPSSNTAAEVNSINGKRSING